MKRGLRKGLSTIVSTLLILLLVFVAIGILWVVVRNVIQGGTEQISLGKFTLDLAIENVQTSGTGLNVRVKRNPGAGEFTGLSFIVDDGQNTEVVQVKNISMGEYSVRTFSVSLTNIIPGNVKKVEVAPIFTLESGKEVVGDVKSKYEISSPTPGTTPTNNCGNGAINSGEQCDGSNLNSATCASALGDSSATGSLSCSSTCSFNTSACVLPSCGNNQLDSGEQCDGSLLNSGTCLSVLGTGYSGTLSCQTSSCQYDTSGCTYTTTCGDGNIEGSETCDDGDASSGDGCSSSCTIESGYSCSGEPSVCSLITCTGSSTQSCTITNGVGEQSRVCTSGTWGGWGTCTVVSCNSGYVQSGNTCVAEMPSWQATGLVSWWKFDGNAQDSKGSNHGTVMGATPMTSGCKNSGCYDFDGTNDYISVGTFSVSGSAITLSAWVNYDLGAEDPRIISKGTSTALANQRWLLMIGFGDFVGRVATNGGIAGIYTGNSVSTGTWAHLVMTYDGSQVILYQNGVSVGSTAKTGSLIVDSSPVWIGGQPTTSTDRPFTGLIDEVMVWNRTLSPSEVSDLYGYSF